MGDRRFDPHYLRLKGRDRAQVLAEMSDEEVVSALAAASREQDPYLANVLATVAHNRLRRATTVAENIGEGLCMVDVHGAVTHANAKAAELLGEEAETLVGKGLHEAAHAHHATDERPKCDLTRLLTATSTVRGETLFWRRGSSFHARLTVTPLFTDDEIEARVVLFQDVTESKRREALLHEQTRVLESAVEQSLSEVRKRAEAEERFRQLFDGNPDPVVVTDDAGLVVLLNARAREALGFGPDLVGTPASALLEGEDTGEVFLRRHARAVPAIVRRKDGTRFRAEASTARLSENGGHLNVTTFRDVTERWRTEGRLREQEALLRQAERLLGLGSWTWDLRTGRLAWSEQLFRIYGHSGAEAPGDIAAFLAHVHRDDLAPVLATLDEARASGEPFEFEHRVAHPDGTVRTVHARGAAECDEDGRVVRLFATGRDVTREREIEAALRRSEARLNRVVETVAEGILVIQRDGRITYANPAAELPDGMVGASREWMREWGPRLRSPDGSTFGDLDGHMEQVMRTGEKRGFEIVLEHPERGRRFLVASAVALREPGGEPSALVSFHDVTELHEAQRRYAQLNEELERRVDRQTDVLRTTIAELEAFSYTVSHDLQAPLRAIEFLTGEFEAKKRPDPEVLSMIQSEVARMRALVRDLLQLSRLSLGDVSREPVDVTALARDAAERLAMQEPGRRVRVVVTPGLVAQADEGLARVLVENLVGNAWKYTSKVEGEATIEVGRVADGVFFVRDNGAGFDGSRAHTLFSPFVRLHSRSEYEGTGIGLATAKRIVKKLGGRIWAQGAPGEGAAFFFTLDGAADANVPQAVAAEPA